MDAQVFHGVSIWNDISSKIDRMDTKDGKVDIKDWNEALRELIDTQERGLSLSSQWFGLDIAAGECDWTRRSR